MLDPPADTLIREEDELLFFAEERADVRLTAAKEQGGAATVTPGESAASAGTVVILGGGGSLLTILHELPENVSRVIIAAGAAGFSPEIMQAADERADFKVSYFDGDIAREDVLTELARRADHIVALSDREKEADDADMESTFLLLKLRDIRSRLGLRYSITAEMRREYNQKLVVTDDNTDFVVASNMSSLILAQLAESPELISTFEELLSNEGSELYLKDAELLRCAGKMTAADIRMADRDRV